MNLLSKAQNIYGLVFASYVSKKDEKEKKDFYKKVRDKASDNSFRYHDLNKPYFNAIFEDTEVKVLGATYYTTLEAGLWVSAQTEDSHPL